MYYYLGFRVNYQKHLKQNCQCLLHLNVMLFNDIFFMISVCMYFKQWNISPIIILGSTTGKKIQIFHLFNRI